MSATLLLVAALGVGPPELVTIGRCHWERPVAAVTVKARPASLAASAVVAKRPMRKKRVASQTPPKPGDEFVGCDEDGPVWTSEIASVEFWPEETPPVTLARVSPAMPTEPSGNVPSEPTFAEGCACGGGEVIVVEYPVFVGGGGGGTFHPPPPIPEPSTFATLLAGLIALAWKGFRWKFSAGSPFSRPRARIARVNAHAGLRRGA